MSHHASRYQTSSDADALSELSDKLTKDLRVHIRSLFDYDVMSRDWIEMADSLGRIANISEMERQMPKSDKDATLWECEELAIRYLLEDGKLNLCLRLLTSYQSYAENLVTTQQSVKPEDEKIMKKFESGICVTLKNAWFHVEAIQTTDLPQLITYIADILNFTTLEDNFFIDFHQKLPPNCPQVLIIYFLKGILTNLDDIGEDRVMSLFLEHQIFGNFLTHLKTFHHQFNNNSEVTVVALEALSLLVDSEYFTTNEEDFVDTIDDLMSDLKHLEILVTDSISSQDNASKRKLRPLLDLIKNHRRK